MTKNTDGLLKGQAGQWRNQPSCTIRVPQKFKTTLINLARGLDVEEPIAPLSLLPLKELLRIKEELPGLIDRRRREARNKLITDNLNLARLVAHRVSNHPVCPFTYEDLEQQAFLALAIAVNNFDPSRGNKLSTFVMPRIRGHLLNFIRDKGTGVKVPRAYYELYFKAIKLERELGSMELVAERLKTSSEKIRESFRAMESCYQSREIMLSGQDWKSPDLSPLAPQMTIDWGDVNDGEMELLNRWLNGGRIRDRDIATLRALLLSLRIQGDRT